MTVSSTERDHYYTATDGQTVFPYNFKVREASDLGVWKNGSKLTLTTDYSVSNVGDASGGNVTLTSGADEDDEIAIVRQSTPLQENDYSLYSNYPVEALEEAVDDAIMAAQDAQGTADRSLRLPDYDSTSDDMTLPAKSERLGKYLSFDDSGLPKASDPPLVGENADISVSNVTNLRAADVSDLSGNETAILLGYNDPGDGGGGTLYWDASSTETDNGGTIFKPDSIDAADPGRWVRRNLDEVNALHFGCVGDWDDSTGNGTDNTVRALAFNTWVINRDKGGVAYYPPGQYLFTGLVAPTDRFSDVTFKGAGQGQTHFIHQRSGGNLFSLIGSQDSDVSLMASVDSKTFELPVSDTSGFSAGDYLSLNDPDRVVTDNTNGNAIGLEGEIVRVREVVDSTTLKVWGGLEFSHGTNATVAKLNLYENVSFEDLTFRNPTPGSTGLAARAIQSNYSRNLIVRNVHFDGLDDDGTRLEYAIDFEFDNCSYKDLSSETAENGGDGYGIVVHKGCWGGIVHDCTSEKCRHLITTGSNSGSPEPAHVLISDCYGREGFGAPFDTHPGGRHFTFDNCYAHGPIENSTGYAPGFQIRTRYSKVVNPTVVNHGVAVFFAAGEYCELVGGTYTNCSSYLKIRSCPHTHAKGGRVINPTFQVSLVEKDASLSDMPDIRIEDLRIDGNPPQQAMEFDHWEGDYVVKDIIAPDIGNLSTVAPILRGDRNAATFILPQDTAREIEFSGVATGLIHIWTDNSDGFPPAPKGLLEFRVGDSHRMNTIVISTATDFTTTTGTVLTGTDGTAGEITISAAGNSIYVENRDSTNKTIHLDIVFSEL